MRQKGGVRTGYVEIGAVDVFARGHPLARCGLHGCAGALAVALVRLADASRPRLVPPREEHEAELLHNVRIGDVEVVLERRVRHEPAELR